MENYQCNVCFERYEDPVQCLKCKANFCQKHIINSDNSCPICKCYPFNFKDNTIINISNINFDLKYICTVCRFGTGDKNTFLRHIFDNHQDEIITIFNMNTIQNKDINQSNKAQKISNVKPFYNMNDSSPNYNNINQIQNNNQQIINKSKNINLQTHRNSKYKQNNINSSQENNINMKKNINPNQKYNKNMKKSINSSKDNSINMKKSINSSQDNSINMMKSINSSQDNSINNNNIKKMHYCGNKNELIKCECCPDHICKEGNCLCVDCMKINFYQFNLSENQLINRAGKVADFYRGDYFCGQEYESIINTVTHRTYRNLKKCEHPYESCDDCKVLTKFSDIYNRFIK